MPEITRKSLLQGKIILKTFNKEKVLIEVSAFFIIYTLLIFNEMNEKIYPKIDSKKVTCFNFEIKHLKIHRNKEKNLALNYRINNSLK